MATRDSQPPLQQQGDDKYTTNDEDQHEAAQLQARLRSSNPIRKLNVSNFCKVPSVDIANGAHKYVLIRALPPGNRGPEEWFVTSKRGASYHRNAAEPMVHKLEKAGYVGIDINGGGRILLDETSKRISIFGYSYGFGQANHAISRQVILEDSRYNDYEVTTSNEGY